VDALPGDKDLLPTSAAAKGVEYCNQLFLLERKYSGRNEKDGQIAELMSSEKRYNARQTQSKPVLEAFYAWLDTVEPAGGSNLAKAVQYAKNEKRYGRSFWATIPRIRYRFCRSSSPRSAARGTGWWQNRSVRSR